MLNISDVSFSYPDGTQALNNVSFNFSDISENEKRIFTILGQSGSGKTTLLNCIARFDSPQKGQIFLDNTNINEIPESEFRKQIGVVFQGLNLFPHMTVLENTLLAQERVQKKSHKQAVEDSMKVLTRLGINDLADSYPNQISGGQAQRVAIARGLVLEPEYMLLDEPTSALDAKTTDEFGSWLEQIASATNLIIVTHDVIFAAKYGSYGIILKEGSIEAEGQLSEIMKHVHEYDENSPLTAKQVKGGQS